LRITYVIGGFVKVKDHWHKANVVEVTTAKGI